MALYRFFVLTTVVVDAESVAEGEEKAVQEAFEQFKDAENSFNLYALLDEDFQEELDFYNEDNE